MPETFFEQAAQHFTIRETTRKKPAQRGSIHLYLNHAWWELTIKPEAVPQDAVGQLDVSLLQQYVLADIFAIQDVRTDKRIDFVGGIRGPEELERLVDSGEWTLAFSMYPTQMADLLAVADSGEIMPPKSTWFEPKLLSGLFLHDLETN